MLLQEYGWSPESDIVLAMGWEAVSRVVDSLAECLLTLEMVLRGGFTALGQEVRETERGAVFVVWVEELDGQTAENQTI